jgi:thiamine-monophosphate kinase
MKPRNPPLGEFGRIARFFKPLAQAFPGSLGLTDDAGLIATPPGKDLIVTTDAIVEGVHFLPSDSAGDIAHKALRVNLSDLAAKGAQPLAYTLTLATPDTIGDDWIEAFAAALASDQSHYGIGLAGGDSVSTAGPLWISITAFGLADRGRMVRRNGAKPGDIVFVTGTIGDAALGLAFLRGEIPVPPEDGMALSDRYRIPQPRCALAGTLAEYASASIDISDGLAADFGHICRASGVRGVIDVSLIPLSPAARRASIADPERLSSILNGGDDYEILFTAPAATSDRLYQVANQAHVSLTQIGCIEAGETGAFLFDANGLPVILDKAGWTHN